MTGIQKATIATGSIGGSGMILGFSLGDVQAWLTLVSSGLFMLSGIIYLLFMFSKWKGFKQLTNAELAAKDADIEASKAEARHWKEKTPQSDE